jgi:hypothetical protein
MHFEKATYLRCPHPDSQARTTWIERSTRNSVLQRLR